jgi:ABC-type transport system involved in multi-copper enzyme maturation permease subunit
VITRATYTIARLTIHETARRRVLLVLTILSLASVALVGWGTSSLVGFARERGVAELQVQIGVSQVLILIAFMFSFVLAMSAAFIAAPAIGADVESGTVLALLARPVRRSDVVVGRWAGLAIVVAGYTAASGLLAIGVVALVSGHTPPLPLVAVGFLVFEALVVLTLGLSLGTRLPGIAAGAISVVLFGLAWFGGVLAGVADVFQAGALRSAVDVLRIVIPTDGLWRGVVYGLEPPLIVLLSRGAAGAVAEANPFYAASPPSLPFVAWSVAWVALVLAAGAWLFRRREL